MSIKIFFLFGLVLLAQAYTEENHVLILTDEDLPGVISEFPYILIEFYAPWYLISHSGAVTAKDSLPSTIKSPRNLMKQVLLVSINSLSKTC
jgi:hypothetical protein